MQPNTLLNYAGAGERFAGYLIDATIVGGIFFANCIAAIFLTPTPNGYFTESQIPSGLVWAFVSWPFIPLVYGLIFALLPVRATPGKSLLKMKIQKPDGSPATRGQLVGREILKWLTGIFVIPYAWIIFDSKRRAVWDIWTGVVITKID